MTAFPIILSAPSGTGKTTIAKALLDRRKDIGYSVSCTTRAPRQGEKEGIDYFFLSRSEFLTKREQGEFAESAEVHGNLYGTLRSEVLRVLKGGQHVLMDIDVQGAVQFTRVFPNSVTVFILPPSAEVLLERLRNRQTETTKELVDRMQSALQELLREANTTGSKANDSAMTRDVVVIKEELERIREQVENLE